MSMEDKQCKKNRTTRGKGRKIRSSKRTKNGSSSCSGLNPHGKSANTLTDKEDHKLDQPNDPLPWHPVKDDLTVINWKTVFWKLKPKKSEITPYVSNGAIASVLKYTFSNVSDPDRGYLTEVKLQLLLGETQVQVRKDISKHTKTRLMQKVFGARLNSLTRPTFHDKPTVETQSLPTIKVMLYLRMIYKRYFSTELLSGCNQRRFFKRMASFLSHSRFTECDVYFFTSVMKVSEIKWLTSLSEDDARGVLSRLLNVIICQLFVELRNVFYVTVNRNGKTLYYTHAKWWELTSMHISLMEKGGLITPESEPNPELIGRGSCMPSGSKFRLLIPFRELIDKITVESTFTIKNVQLSTGKVLTHLIEFITSLRNTSCLVNATSVGHLSTLLTNYLVKHRKSQNICGIKCDIEKCYDQLSYRDVMKKVEYEIFKFANNGDAEYIYFTFKTRMHLVVASRCVPYDWEFSTTPNEQWSKIPLSIFLIWISQTYDFKINLNKKVYSFMMIPHSLMISKVSVCLFLQLRSEQCLRKVSNVSTNNLLVIRLVDDIIILVNNRDMSDESLAGLGKTISEYYKALEKKLFFNDDKLQVSPLLTSFFAKLSGQPLMNENLEIGTVTLDPQRHTIEILPRPKQPRIYALKSSWASFRTIPTKISRNIFGCLGYVINANFFNIKLAQPNDLLEQWTENLTVIFAHLSHRIIHLLRSVPGPIRRKIKPECSLKIKKIIWKIFNTTKTKLVNYRMLMQEKGNINEQQIYKSLEGHFDVLIKRAMIRSVLPILEKSQMVRSSDLVTLRCWKVELDKKLRGSKIKWNTEPWQFLEWSYVDHETKKYPWNSELPPKNDYKPV